MTEETEEYLVRLQEKINNTGTIFVEQNEDFNREYLVGRKIIINDVVSAIRKLEG